jgi:signal transduction histidine kinase
MAAPVRSIRQQLLSSSLLAVLGGYGLLLGAHALFAAQERRHDHRVLITSVQQEILPLAARANGAEALSARLTQLVSPNLIVWIETEQGYPYRPPRQLGGFQLPQGTTLPQLLIRASLQQSSADHPAIVRAGERTYLLSATSLRLQGQPLRLQLLEDVTAKVAGERTTRLLLLLAAAIATLFTGLLLRPALARGLAPLRDLGRRMQAIGSESLERDQLPLDALPRELLPIAGEFNALLQRLAASWERQRDFVNGVSHELRTPITLIGSYAGRLRRRGTDLGPEEKDQLLLIEEESQRMARLVADLLDLARSDARQLLLADEPFDAGAALERVVSRLDASCGGRLRLEHLSQPAMVCGDGQQYEHCVANLIENAIKYAPPSTAIELRLEQQPDDVVTHVIDRGPGVPEEERQRIFDRFQRGRHTASIPGSGIGLAVVQTLIQGMGGSVTVAEARGGGADFQLRLRRAPLLPAT